mgnify:CR=1 FL=1
MTSEASILALLTVIEQQNQQVLALLSRLASDSSGHSDQGAVNHEEIEALARKVQKYGPAAVREYNAKKLSRAGNHVAANKELQAASKIRSRQEAR